MRIRSVALAYMAGMGLIALSGSAVVAYKEWRHLATVDEAEALVRVIGSANRFVEAMALERGVYNQIVVSRDTVPEEKQRLIAERVAITDGVFDETLTGLSQLQLDEARGLSEPVAEARRIVTSARARADAVWQGTSLESATGAAQALVSEFVRASGVLDQTVIRLERAHSERDPRLGLMMSVSRLSNDLRDAAGQRSTILSRYAGTQQRIDAATASRISELTGGIKVTWDRLQRVVRQVGQSPKVETALARTRTTFMEEGERTYLNMTAAAREGTPPVMDFLVWRAWTVRMLANTLVARDAPVEQALDDLSLLELAARARLAFALGSAGGAALLILVISIYVQRRVVRPIVQLTAAIDGTADDVSDATAGSGKLALGSERLIPRYEAREDEIGSLARALGRFQERTSEVRRLNERFDAALANLPQGLCVFDADQQLVVCNARFAEVYKLQPEQTAPGTPIRSILEHRVAANAYPRDARDYIGERLAKAARSEPWESVDELCDGRTIAVRSRPIPGGGWLATHEDITDRRRAEAQIAHMARHDPLTDLPNRLVLREGLEQALARVGRHGEGLALLCLDLDHFKAVNDTLGHPLGDALLQAVADRLRSCIRETDTVARLGGDEFVILQVGADQPVGATALARRVINAISAPYDLDGHQVLIGASVGIAVSPDDRTDPDQLLKSADMALYRAKADGRGTLRFFEPEMDANMQSRRALELDLREALAQGAFEVHYQPLVSLVAGEVCGFEALLRWRHPTRGQVPPDQFISVAEEVGLIGAIGAWVLREACTVAATWPSHINVAVNLSPAQFRNRQLVFDVIGALSASGLSPSRLELEITETAMLMETEATLAMLRQLRELGVRIAMDDFGTGYSSLSYLRKFPFDKIKIDGSFVRDLANTDDSVAILRAVTRLGSDLGIPTTAEGVETHEQLAMLRAQGCIEAQGYLFSPAVPADKVLELVETIGRAMKEAA